MFINKKTNQNTKIGSSSTSTLAITTGHVGQFNLFAWMLILSTIAIYGIMETEAYPVNLMMPRKYPVNVEVENPEELISILDNLIQNILVGIDSSHSNTLINDKSNNSKRGIDLGLSRGFSGSQAAKHLMGMSAASFANGPGKKR